VGRAHTRCDFDPHHAFVFFDAAGAPVANLQVCFECGEWVAEPHIDGIGDSPSMMRADESAAVVRLCDELHLGACFLADRAKMDALEEKWRAARVAPEGGLSTWGARAIALPVKVEPSRSLADTSIEERRSLCAWYVRAHSAAFPIRGGSYECASGRKWSVLGFDECLATFPRCAVTVGAAHACMRGLLEGDVCAQKAPCANGVDGCTWGLRTPTLDGGAR
jgi:hypothetical protein